MKQRIFIGLTFVITCLAMIPSVFAQTAPRSAILYKITGKTLKKPSYIFGTQHLLCEKDFTTSEKLAQYFGQARHVMLEVDTKDLDLLKSDTTSMMLADGKSLKDYLTKEEFAQLDNIFRSYLGVSFELFQKMKPMYASLALLISPKITGCVQPMMLDDLLAQAAIEMKIPVTGLETAKEQMQMIDKQPMAEHIKALKELAANPDKSIGQYKTLTKTYLSQDSDALYAMISSEMKQQGFSLADLLDNRNIRWIPLIEKQIKIQPTFIGVGAGHLGGENGVVKLLRKKGYILTPIRL